MLREQLESNYLEHRYNEKVKSNKKVPRDYKEFVETLVNSKVISDKYTLNKTTKSRDIGLSTRWKIGESYSTKTLMFSLPLDKEEMYLDIAMRYKLNSPTKKYSKLLSSIEIMKSFENMFVSKVKDASFGYGCRDVEPAVILLKDITILSADVYSNVDKFHSLLYDELSSIIALNKL